MARVSRSDRSAGARQAEADAAVYRDRTRPIDADEVVARIDALEHTDQLPTSYPPVDDGWQAHYAMEVPCYADGTNVGAIDGLAEAEADYAALEDRIRRAPQLEDDAMLSGDREARDAARFDREAGAAQLRTQRIHIDELRAAHMAAQADEYDRLARAALGRRDEAEAALLVVMAEHRKWANVVGTAAAHQQHLLGLAGEARRSADDLRTVEGGKRFAARFEHSLHPARGQAAYEAAQAIAHAGPPLVATMLAGSIVAINGVARPGFEKVYADHVKGKSLRSEDIVAALEADSDLDAVPA